MDDALLEYLERHGVSPDDLPDEVNGTPWEDLTYPEMKVAIQSLLIPDMRAQMKRALHIPADPDECPEERREDGTLVEYESYYSCPKCAANDKAEGREGSDKTSNRVREPMLQMRSADEGMDVMCECRSCGHKFRVRN